MTAGWPGELCRPPTGVLCRRVSRLGVCQGHGNVAVLDGLVRYHPREVPCDVPSPGPASPESPLYPALWVGWGFPGKLIW